MCQHGFIKLALTIIISKKFAKKRGNLSISNFSSKKNGENKIKLNFASFSPFYFTINALKYLILYKLYVFIVK